VLERLCEEVYGLGHVAHLDRHSAQRLPVDTCLWETHSLKLSELEGGLEITAISVNHREGGVGFGCVWVLSDDMRAKPDSFIVVLPNVGFVRFTHVPLKVFGEVGVTCPTKLFCGCVRIPSCSTAGRRQGL